MAGHGDRRRSCRGRLLWGGAAAVVRGSLFDLHLLLLPMAGLVEADRGGRERIRRCLRASVWSRREAFPCGAGSVGHWRCDSAGVRRAGHWFRRKELREAAAEEESGGCLVGLAAVVCWLLELSRTREGRTVVGRESKKKKEGAGSRKEKESCGGLGGEEDGGTG